MTAYKEKKKSISNTLNLNQDSIISLEIESEECITKNFDPNQPINSIPIPGVRVVNSYFNQTKAYNERDKKEYIIFDLKEVNSNIYESKDIEYGIDSEDEEWISENANDIDEETLEIIIDYLEKESFKHREFQQFESNFECEDDVPCCVCGERDYSDNNLIVFCDGCNLAIHQDCQGLKCIPEEEWYCDACKHYINHIVSDISCEFEEIKCVLCKKSGSAFKQTNKESFVHILCSFLAPELFYEKEFVNIDLLDYKRDNLICTVCGEKGGCVQCGIKKCYNSFHSLCAQKNGLVFMFSDSTLEINKGLRGKKRRRRSKSKSETSTQFKCLCTHHSAIYKAKQFEKFLSDPTVRAEVGKFINIYTYNNIKKLINKNLSNESIDKIIGYWKRKRNKYKNGKVPLIYQLNFMIEFGNKPFDAGYKLNARKIQKKYELYIKNVSADQLKSNLDLQNLRRIAKKFIDSRDRKNSDVENYVNSKPSGNHLPILKLANNIRLSLKKEPLKLNRNSNLNISTDCTSKLINYSKKEEDMYNRFEFCK